MKKFMNEERIVGVSIVEDFCFLGDVILVSD